MNSYGTIHIKLDDLIKEAGISKSKLSHCAEMQRTQINNFCNNKITRLDTDVLARLCSALDCNISDLLEYIPPEKEQNAGLMRISIASDLFHILYSMLADLSHLPTDSKTALTVCGFGKCIPVYLPIAPA